MGKIIWYEHHGRRVAVDEELKGKHKEHCLCFRCARFSFNGEDNCKLAELNFANCRINDMVLPVWECPDLIENKSLLMN